MARHRIEYRDKAFLLIMVVVCSIVFSLLDDLVSGSFDGIRFASLTTNFFYSFIFLALFREMVHLGDRYLPWAPNIHRRVALQFLFSLIIYVLLQGLIVFLLEPNLSLNVSPPILTSVTFLVGIALLIIMNVAYVLMYLSWKEGNAIDKGNITGAHIFGTYDASRIAVAYDQFKLFLLENGYVYGYDKEQRKIKIQENLSDLEKTLDPQLFFRANRQTIIAKKHISSFVLNANKSCTVDCKDIEQQITISRHRVPLFKRWVQEP